MSKYLLGAAAAALVIAGGSLIGSHEAQADCSLPGGDNTQWTCDVNESTSVQNVIIYWNAGGATGRCKDGTIETTTTTETALNPALIEPGTDNFDGDSTEVTTVIPTGGTFACPTNTQLYDKDGNPL